MTDNKETEQELTQDDIEALQHQLHDQANNYYINDEFATALNIYTQALKINDRDIDLLLHRAQCYIKLNKYYNAETDCRRVIMLSNNMNHIAYYRCGIALFHSDRYKDALHMFQQCQKLQPDYLQTDIYIRKCKAELVSADSSPKQTTATATTPSVSKTATSKPTTTTAEPTKTSTATTKQQTSVPNASTATIPLVSSATSTPSSTDTATPPTDRTPTQSLAEKVRTDFSQMNDDIVMTIFAKNVKQEQCDIKLNDDGTQLYTEFTLPDQSVYKHNYLLYSAVTTDPNHFNLRVTPYKIEISLQKLTNAQWKVLERSETAQETADRLQQLPSAYVNTKNIDWSEIDKTVTEQLEEEKKSTVDKGDKGLQEMFQQIYANADEDTKRAMIKSFQTSGGTVLSTNWKEVQKADYEHDPSLATPAGQERRTWDEVTRGKKTSN